MKRRSKVQNLIYLAILMTVMMWGASQAFAGMGTVEGTVEGLNCVVYGKICPLDKADPHVATENIFVVLSSDHKKYYFVPNVERSILARMLGKKVRVSGVEKMDYNAVMASKIEVESDGKYEVKWSQQMENEQRIPNYFGRGKNN
jgi:hypothetical protein